MQRKLVGENQYETALMLTTLAEILVARDRAAEAERVLRESLTILRKALPEGHWMTGEAKSLLGGCLTLLGRYQEAEPLLASGYQTIARLRGQGDTYAVEALERVIQLYEAWGKSDKALEYRAMLRNGD